MVLSEKDVPRRIGIENVESAANTFTAKKLDLPNTKGETVYDLDKVEMRMNSQAPAAADDLGVVKMQIQRNTGSTPTAMLLPEDERVLYEAYIEFTSGTEAADITNINKSIIGADHKGYAEYIANDSVWMCVEGISMAGAYSQRGWLIGSVEKLNANQLQALLLSQFN